MMQNSRRAWPDDPLAQGTGLPLEGVRVLDLSRVLAGPLAAMVAADLGADVIKVEPPSGDPVRGMAPPSVDGVATYYLSVNRNRRGIVADLATTEGRELVARLAREADAVIENYLPSQARSLGIADLRDELTGVVWVTIAAASGGGPLADLPSFDLLAQARSGVMSVTGDPEGGPTKVGAPVADVVTGLYAAIALLAGLFERKGDPDRPARRMEAPLLESMMVSLVNQATGYLATDVVPGRMGNDHPSITPYGLYATGDLPLLLAVGTERQWEALCMAIGADQLSGDGRFATNQERAKNRDQLRVELEAVLRTKGIAQWLGRLDAHGVPCAPVNDIATAMAQPQIALGDLLVNVELASGTTVAMMGSPLRVDGERLPIRRRPPTLGEHNAEIITSSDED